MTDKSRKRTNDDEIEHVHVSLAKYVAVDIELTGLDEQRDSITAIGAIKMTGGRIELGETFYRMMDSGGGSIQGVDLKGSVEAGCFLKPETSTALSEFLSLCGNSIIVGHLIFTDLAILKNEVNRSLGMEVKNHALDTYKLYHWLMRRESSGWTHSSEEVKLYEVAAHLGIAAPGDRNAVNDAFVTAQVFQRLLPLLISEGVKTVGELLRIGDPDKGLN
ncbi:MAG TPA: 3'-5' exonuclease [Dissulfurispiraceae bacterium]|nr:3'-5' exonuclease [Dissulfurispiraceae bacterium]